MPKRFGGLLRRSKSTRNSSAAAPTAEDAVDGKCPTKEKKAPSSGKNRHSLEKGKHEKGMEPARSSSFLLTLRRGSAFSSGDNSCAGPNLKKFGSYIESHDWKSVRAVLDVDAIANREASDPADATGMAKAQKAARKRVLSALENLSDFTGQNALHHVCRFRPPPDVVEQILALRPDLPLRRDCLGRTPLHAAAGWGCDVLTAKTLLDGAASELAVAIYGPDFVDGGDGDASEADSEADRCRMECFRDCAERVAGSVDTYGKTPLHFAADYLVGEEMNQLSTDSSLADQALRVVRLLVEAGPDAANAEDSNGTTPLDLVLAAQDDERRGSELGRKAARYMTRGRREYRHDRSDRDERRTGERRRNSKSKAVDPRRQEASSQPEKSRSKDKKSKPQLCKIEHSCKEEENEDAAAAEDDDLLAARLAELMGLDGREDMEEDISLERLKSAILGQKNLRATLEEALKAKEAEAKQRKKTKLTSPPLKDVEVPLQNSDGDDGVSAITMPHGLEEALPPSEKEKKKETSPKTGDNEETDVVETRLIKEGIPAEKDLPCL